MKPPPPTHVHRSHWEIACVLAPSGSARKVDCRLVDVVITAAVQFAPLPTHLLAAGCAYCKSTNAKTNI